MAKESTRTCMSCNLSHICTVKTGLYQINLSSIANTREEAIELNEIVYAAVAEKCQFFQPIEEGK